MPPVGAQPAVACETSGAQAAGGGGTAAGSTTRGPAFTSG
jgi:hypothetical protein